MMRSAAISITVRADPLPTDWPVEPDPSKPSYLDVLAGECGLFMRLYALGGTCLLVFLLALALFTL
jgi:hypothetical protein